MESINKGVYMIQPLQCSTVSFQGNDKTEENKKKRIPDISTGVDEFSRETEEVTHSVAKASKSITGLIGQVSTTALGIWALIKTPFMKAVNFFTETVKPEVKNEAGEVVEQAVKKVNFKKLGTAGAVIAAVLGALAIAKGIDKKSEKSEKAEKAEKAEETDEKDTAEISKKEELSKMDEPADIEKAEEPEEELEEETEE